MIGILEVGAVCARMRAASLDLFEQLGAWVTDTRPGDEQRRWATWCHRHAWHAELWERRAPAIRPFDLDAATADARGWLGAPADPADRGPWHAAVTTELRHELDALAGRVDPVTDPSTARTIALVRADLAAV